MRVIGLFSPALISIAIKHSRNSGLAWQMPPVLVEYGIYVLINVWLTTTIITIHTRNCKEVYRSYVCSEEKG